MMVLDALARRQGPVPWVEITVGEPVIAKVLGRLPRDWMPEREADIYLGLSWEDRLQFARSVGLWAVGIYHWESLGSYQMRERQVIRRQPLIRSRSDLVRLRAPRIVPGELRREWDETLRINATGTFLCGTLAARRMVAQGIRGNIVNIASASGRKDGRVLAPTRHRSSP
jgi:hypothetical protein